MLGISGLHYVANYIDADHESALIDAIDVQPWRTDLSRRTQHYGYVYDYKARRVDPSMYLGVLPTWLHEIAHRLCKDGLMPAIPDQAIINEYEPGQGIADHIDCIPCFGDVIASLSIGAAATMNFKRDDEKVEVWLEQRSLITMKGEARYVWTHGIAKRKSDRQNGRSIPRRRRLSITFRKVTLET